MRLTNQEKAFLVDELDEYFDQVAMESNSPLVSETIVSLLDDVLNDEAIEDQENAARAKIGNFVWDKQICYGIDTLSLYEGLDLRGKRYSYKAGDVVDVTEIFRILKRIETVDFEIREATEAEKQEGHEIEREMQREHRAHLPEIREKLKDFAIKDETI